MINEPLFWILGILSGVFWNIISNLLTPMADRLLSQFSEGRKKKTKQKRLLVMREVIVMLEKDTRIILAKLDSVYALLLACTLFLLITLSLRFPGFLPYHLSQIVLLAVGIISCLLMLMAFYSLSWGLRRMRIANLALKRARENSTWLRLSQAKDHPEKLEALEKQDCWDREHIGITFEDVMNEIENKKKD